MVESNSKKDEGRNIKQKVNDGVRWGEKCIRIGMIVVPLAGCKGGAWE